MATFAFVDAKILIGESDLSGHTNQVTLTYEADELDATVFGNTHRTRIGGLKTVQVSGTSLYDDTLQAVPKRFMVESGSAGATDVFTISPNGGTNGDDAYGFKSLPIRYGEGGEVGGLFEQPWAAQGRSVAFSGVTLCDVDTARTATFSTTGVQLGAVQAGETLYATLHAITVTGTSPTLDGVIESDDNSGFTSATTRITFSQATVATAEWGSVAGAVTDDWWRFTGTIGGTGPTFYVGVAIGIV